MFKSFIATLLSLLIAASSAAQKPTTIDLGGPRQVKAVLTASDREYVILLSMLPVHTFDEVTNTRLNREKGRSLALQALAKHLSGTKDVELSVSRVTIEKQEMNGKNYTITLRVPRDSVVLLDEKSKPAGRKTVEKGDESEHVAYTSALFTRKLDIVDTLEKLSCNLASELEEATSNVKNRKVNASAFYSEIADLEERWLIRLERIFAEVDSESLLLTVEKVELKLLVEKQKGQVLQLLKARLEKFEEKGKTENDESADKFSDLEIDPLFGKYLRADPLLMEVTGTKIILLAMGNRIVIAVASTVLKDNLPKERLRAEKVCRIKALASIVGDKQGVQVCRVEQVKERTVVVLDGEIERAKSVSELLQITQTKVEGVAKDMPVVGTWKSKERDVFYLAIGIVCDKGGKEIDPKQIK